MYTFTHALNILCGLTQKGLKFESRFCQFSDFFFFFFLKGTFAEEYDLHHSFSDSCKLFKLRNLVQEESLAFRNLSSHTQQTSVQLNDRNTRKSFGISHWRCSGVFILSFKPVSHLFLSNVSMVSFQLVHLYEIG